MAGDDDLISGPRWRTRTSPAARQAAALFTFVVLFSIGLAEMLAVWWVLERVGAPEWLRLGVWLVPMVAVLAWTLLRPAPAMPTDHDELSWPGYAICFVLVGESEPRPAPVRVIAAVLVGAPTGWVISTVGVVLLLVGLA